MRKALFLMMLLCGMMSQAQEMEYLDSVRIAPDPMYGNVGRTEWRSEHMQFIFFDDGTFEWHVVNPPRIFERGRIGREYTDINNVRVGIFTADDSLIVFSDKWKGIISEHGTVLKMAAKAKVEYQGKTVNVESPRVFATLRARKGSYVRLVLNVYGDYYWEVKARMR